MGSLYPANPDLVNIPAICLSVADKPEDIDTFNHYWALMARESANNAVGKDQVLSSLAQAFFAFLLRSIPLDEHPTTGVRGEHRLFQRFNQLIDLHYHEHLAVPEYAKKLGVTESRLKDMCRRFANSRLNGSFLIGY